VRRGEKGCLGDWERGRLGERVIGRKGDWEIIAGCLK